MKKNKISGYYAAVIQFFEDTIWDLNRKDPFWKDILFELCRLGYLVIHGITRKRLAIRATALAYTTLLSIVPLIAVSMALFKAFGGFSKVESKLQPLILDNLAIGTGEVVQKYILQFTENLHAGALGIVGFAFLTLTVVGLLSTIEAAFNDIWGVQKSRSWFRRFNSYWTILTVGPILMALSIGLTAYFNKLQISQSLVKFSPYILTWFAFTLLYFYMPNTKVKIRSALFGGVLAGTLWEIAKHGYTVYAAKTVTYSAIYGSLGALPIFLIWIYLTWVIVLIGAEVSFANQNIQTYREERRTTNLSYTFKEFLALNLIAYICEAFKAQKGSVTSTDLIKYFGLPVRVVNELLHHMTESGILIETGEHERYYCPSRPLSKILVMDVIESIRETGDEPPKMEATKQVKYFTGLTREMNQAFYKAAGNKNFDQIVSELPSKLKVVKK